MSPSSAAGRSEPERDHRLLYTGVIVVEILVLAGIYLFQRYFGS